jgi:hypothetical protein
MDAQDMPGDTEVMDAVDMPADTETMASQETAGDTQPMPAQERRFSDTSELVDPIDRSPENMESASGYAGSQAKEDGYGAFRTRVRLAGGEVVDAIVKVFPGEAAAKFQQEVAGAQAAAATGIGPEFYGVVPVPNGPGARRGTNDVAFAMEPVEGAFAFPGTDSGDPGHARAVTESQAAAGRITDGTIESAQDFSSAILNEGYYYDGEFQGLIGPNGDWRPIDFGPVKPLPPPENVAAYEYALAEHNRHVNEEIESMERARREASPDYIPDDPTDRTSR